MCQLPVRVLFLRERDIGKLVFGLQLFDLWNLRIDFFLPFLQAPFVAQANLFVIMQDIFFFSNSNSLTVYLFVEQLLHLIKFGAHAALCKVCKCISAFLRGSRGFLVLGCLGVGEIFLLDAANLSPLRYAMRSESHSHI